MNHHDEFPVAGYEERREYKRRGRRSGERHVIEQGVKQWLNDLEADADYRPDYASFEDATHLSANSRR